jgi:predicted HTH domain antitoxin
MIKHYGDGKVSLEDLAKILGLSVGGTIDLLSELGIESPIEYEDYHEGFAVLANK